MKLLLRPDTYRVSTPDGLCVLTHHGLVTFDGASIAAWLDRLEPYLDGRFGVDDLVANLDGERGRMLEQVIQALVDADVVREVEDVAPGPAVPPGANAPEVHYLGYFLDTATATATWRRYRDCGALVIGRGALAAAAARACERSGITRVYSAGPDEPPDALARDPGIVLHVSDDADLTTDRRSRETCSGPQTVLGHAADFGDHAVLGPVGTGPQDRESARRRMLGLRREVPPGRPADAADLAAVANQLVHRAFRVFAGIAGDTERDRLTRVTYDLLDSTHHAFLPHPYTRPATTPARARFGADVGKLRRGAKLTVEEMSRRTAPLVDDRAGVFGEIDQRGFAQFPLHVSEATVADPVGLGLGPVRVAGVGPDYATARYRAAMHGYAAYGSLCLDPRRLLGRGAGDPDTSLAELRSGEAADRVWGYRLADGHVLEVDAARAFPVLAGAGAEGFPVCGSAAGYTWEDAVRTALLDQCRALAVSGIAALDEPVPPVDAGAVARDPVAVRYHALLCATGRPVETYDLTRVLDVPCVLVRGAGDAGAGVCGVGASTAEAFRDGLEKALLAYQSAVNAEPAYAPPQVPAPRELFRGTRSSALDDTALTVEGIAAALRARGREPVVVPMDHDREVTQRVPYLVQVVLDHG
ncbi:hypothetical protein [Streptomonospora wellingtoniae]|uniref:YcaO domain-containing protein n=1 Tax=Streptomonospora wellingtoniae TaxID=3075544 RepID=A0ABU2KWF6_9ACTN|nr:hypothetical protein [Streptomonospora sp. DSM 45055]MDT0303588.1 hypothetical protein [Streptomonospora sp. DSM 45055]